MSTLLPLLPHYLGFQRAVAVLSVLFSAAWLLNPLETQHRLP